MVYLYALAYLSGSLLFTLSIAKKAGTSGNIIKKNDKYNYREGEIDPYLNTLSQDDPELVKTVKDFFADTHSDKFSRNLPKEKMDLVASDFGHAPYVMDLYDYQKLNGFFVEAGAFDGVTQSNSLLMETAFNWTGVLIEPDPESYQELLETRRKVWSFNCCLSRKTTPEVIMFNSSGIHSSIVKEGCSNQKEKLLKRLDNESEKIKGRSWKFIKMQCFPLYTILLAVNRTHVDFLNLDMNGSELEVLKTIPWDEITIDLISLRHTKTAHYDLVADKKFNIKSGYLDARGYREVVRVPRQANELESYVIFMKRGVSLGTFVNSFLPY